MARWDAIDPNLFADPLKAAAMRKIDQQMGDSASWDEFAAAVKAEIKLQQHNAIDGIEPDAEFKAALEVGKFLQQIRDKDAAPSTGYTEPAL